VAERVHALPPLGADPALQGSKRQQRLRTPYWRGRGQILSEAELHTDAIPVDPTTGCWLWGAGLPLEGHSFAWDGTKHVDVQHRVWELTRESLAKDHRLWCGSAELRCVAPTTRRYDDRRGNAFRPRHR